MVDVPVTYLHWFYHNATIYNSDAQNVADYIKDSIDALKMENKNLIWTK